MAKQPQITIQVQSQQFQQFAKQFNAFSGQVRQLNSQFGQINASLQKSNVFIRGIQATLAGAERAAQSLVSSVTKVTKQFLSWRTIIGGVTALLGLGGSLYGIERLAANIMQKRRQALGLGQDYGRTQASAIFSQGLMSSPMETMQNIRMGMAGSPDQLTALMTMGINPFGRDARLSPDEVMDKIVAKLPDLLKRAGPGKELLMARAYGLDKLFTDPMDLLRLSTDEGRKEYEEKRKLVAEYEKFMKISPRAQKAWTELELQFQAAKAQIESVFGEKLADLSAPLRHLSDAFLRLIRILMDSPTIQKLIKDLSGWIDKLATKMKNLSEKDIDDFIKTLRDLLPSAEEFKATMHEFVEILKFAIEALKFAAHPVDYIKKNVLPKAYEPAQQGSTAGPAPGPTTGPNPYHQPPSVDIRQYLPKWLGGTSAQTPAATPSQTPTSPSTQTPTSPAPAPAPTLGGGPQTVPGVSLFGGGGVGGFGPTGVPTGAQAGVTGGWGATVGNQVPTTGTMPSSTQGGATGGTPFSARFGSWSSATSKMIPSPQSGRGNAATKEPAAGPSQGGGLGPLSLNNWQMNRTASLVVRNVPGSNIFMTATGMTG